MATSIQLFADRSAIFKDLDLIALICLLEQRLEAEFSEYGDLKLLVSRWQNELKNYGPGTIELELDELADSVEVHEQLVSLLVIIRDEVEKLGATISAADLNRNCRVQGLSFCDYSPSLLSSTISRLLDLISPKKGPEI